VKSLVSDLSLSNSKLIFFQYYSVNPFNFTYGCHNTTTLTMCLQLVLPYTWSYNYHCICLCLSLCRSLVLSQTLIMTQKSPVCKIMHAVWLKCVFCTPSRAQTYYLCINFAIHKLVKGSSNYILWLLWIKLCVLYEAVKPLLKLRHWTSKSDELQYLHTEAFLQNCNFNTKLILL